jgi:hypothetical protein
MRSENFTRATAASMRVIRKGLAGPDKAVR